MRRILDLPFLVILMGIGALLSPIHALADTLFGNKPRTASLKNVPTAVFTIPPAATVGLTEEEAEAAALASCGLLARSAAPLPPPTPAEAPAPVNQRRREI
jgi:hypothetical protein